MHQFLTKICRFIGAVSSVLIILLMLNICYDVFTRYVLNDVSIGMQELEWHLFATAFLFGITYAIVDDGHVRVDFVYERLSTTKQAWIDIGGTCIFLIPFAALIMWYGIDYTHQAYTLGETSGDPGGLPHRWIIKGMIPLSAAFMLLAAAFILVQSIGILRGVINPKNTIKEHLS